MSPDEFAEKIKAKYPDYRDVPNDELSKRIVEKHPEYASQVDFSATPTPAARAQEPGLIDRAVGFIDKHGAEMMGGALGAARGAAMGAPGGPAGIAIGAVAGAGLGGFGGKILDTGVDALAGRETPGLRGALAEAGQAGTDQMIGEVVGRGLASAPVRAGAARAFDYAAENLGGVAKGTMQFARENLPTVSKYIGAGKERIGAFAGDIRDSLRGAVDASEQVYRNIASKVSGRNPEFGPGIKINLRDAVSATIDDVERQFGYNSPPPIKTEVPKTVEIFDQFGNTASKKTSRPLAPAIPEDSVKRVVGEKDVALFHKFKGLAGQLKEATPQQVYFFQRDLNSAILENEGRPISAALGQVKSAVNKMIEDNADKLPDLVTANRAWRSAQELASETRGFQNSEDMIQYVKNAYSANKYDSSRRRMLEEVGSQVPGVGRAIEEVRSALAAEQLSPIFRGLPQTGMGFGIAASGGAAAYANPALLPLAAVASPRAYYVGLRAAQSPAAAKAATGARFIIQRGGGSLADYYGQK